ncbi:MAG: Zn-ribbon domain-containing protein [Candidatus Woesearchaeota archaeon]|nr:Zn-ribbon domain-containing protein [Candidatus Woesearchaeota archaeon]
MPHQCVRCGTLYDDGAREILRGCKCGARLFFYIKKERLEQLKHEKEKEAIVKLTPEERKKIEEDVYDVMGIEPEEEKPVILDLEAIKVSKPGKFEIDLVHLFNKKEPIIYKLEEGKYIIDLAETFKRVGEERKRKK